MIQFLKIINELPMDILDHLGTDGLITVLEWAVCNNLEITTEYICSWRRFKFCEDACRCLNIQGETWADVLERFPAITVVGESYDTLVCTDRTDYPVMTRSND